MHSILVFCGLLRGRAAVPVSNIYMLCIDPSIHPFPLAPSLRSAPFCAVPSCPSIHASMHACMHARTHTYRNIHKVSEGLLEAVYSYGLCSYGMHSYGKRIGHNYTGRNYVGHNHVYKVPVVLLEESWDWRRFPVFALLVLSHLFVTTIKATAI